MYWIYKILPAFLIRTKNKWLLPGTLRGKVYWMFIFIRKDIKNEESTIQHELVHVKQNYRLTPIFYRILYSKEKWRLKFEVEAFKKSIEYGRDVKQTAHTLKNKYNIKSKNVEEIYSMLVS